MYRDSKLLLYCPTPFSREAISFMRPLIHCGRGGFIRGGDYCISHGIFFAEILVVTFPTLNIQQKVHFT
jgi:hypothetical protein